MADNGAPPASSELAGEIKYNAWKLMSDPALGTGTELVYRINGHGPQDPYNPPDEKRDPRAWSRILSSRRVRAELKLEVPRYKIDDNYVGTPPSTQLLVTNLNNNVDENFLRKLCEKHGKLVKIRVRYNPSNKKHLGIAEVAFDCVEYAQSFLKAHNNKPLMGQVLGVVDDPRGELSMKAYYEKLLVPDHPAYPSSYIVNIAELKEKKPHICGAAYVPFIPSSESLENEKQKKVYREDNDESYYVWNDDDYTDTYNDERISTKRGCYANRDSKGSYSNFAPRFNSSPIDNDSIVQMYRSPPGSFAGRGRGRGRGRKNFNNPPTKRPRYQNGTDAEEAPNEPAWDEPKPVSTGPTRERTPDWDDMDADTTGDKKSSNAFKENGTNGSPQAAWDGPASYEQSQPQAVRPPPTRERTPDWDEPESEPSSSTQTQLEKPVFVRSPPQSAWDKPGTNKQLSNGYGTNESSDLAWDKPGINQQSQTQPVRPPRERTPDWDEPESETTSGQPISTQMELKKPFLERSPPQSTRDNPETNKQLPNGYRRNVPPHLAWAGPGTNNNGYGTNGSPNVSWRKPGNNNNGYGTNGSPNVAWRKPRNNNNGYGTNGLPNSAWGKPKTNKQFPNGYRRNGSANLAQTGLGTNNNGYGTNDTSNLAWTGPGATKQSQPEPVRPTREPTPDWDDPDAGPTWDVYSSQQKTSSPPKHEAALDPVLPQAAWCEPGINQQSQPQAPERERTPDWDDQE